MSRVQGRRTLAARGVTFGIIAAGCITPMIAATPAVAAASLCGPPADTVPPQVSDLTFSTTSVDLGSTSRSVTITAQAADTSGNGPASGIRDIQAFLEGPDVGVNATLKLASGTDTDGTWTDTFSVPKSARPGTLRLDSVDLSDHDGNGEFYDGYSSSPQSPDDIRLQSGWQQTIALTGTPPKLPAKKKSGALKAFSSSPAAVNTTKAAKNVKVTASFSGRQPKRVEAYYQSLDIKRVLPRQARLTRHGNTWSGHIRVPRWIGDGTFQPQVFADFGAKLTPSDRSWGPAQLKSKYGAANLKVTSGTDKTKPVLKGLTITPSAVNTTTGDETVTVKAIATDTQSGVARVDANLYTNDGNESGGAASGLYPYPGVGYSQSGYANVNLKHTTGNTWVGTTVFRECEPSGTWHVSVDLNDKANNYTDYQQKKLIADGLPGTITVTSTPGDIVDPYVYGATASSQDGTATLDFSEGVKNVDSTDLTVYQVGSSGRLEQAKPIGSIVCSNGHATVACSGSSGLITSAVLHVAALTGRVGTKYEVFANQDNVTSQLTDGTGNPMDWNQPAANLTDS